MTRAERVLALEAARDAALKRLTQASPYARFLGVELIRFGDELTGRLPYAPHLIGNPILPALHGGAIGSLLEVTAQLQLSWDQIWARIEAGGAAAAAIAAGEPPPSPKTIDINVDYLRSGRPHDVFARAIVSKKGRRVANVRVEAWQSEQGRPIAAAHGHFMVPETDPS